MATPRPTASRILVGTAALALALVSSCDKKGDTATTPPAPGAAGAVAADSPGFAPTSVTTTPIAAVDKITVVASVADLEDTLKAVKKIGESFAPDSATDPMSGLEAQLLALGFGPGFLGNIDLGGTHVVSSSFPAQGQGGQDDVNFSGSIAVTDGRKVIDSTPSAYRPQPLGEGMWEFTDDDVRVLVKEAGKELQLGLSVQDLDVAARLQSDAGPGRRVRMRATNIPVDEIDPAELFGLPDIKIVRDFTKVLQDLEALELELELGTKSDFELIASVFAPFHKLGLAPLGTPRTAPTRVEALLPPGPIFAMSVAYGDPAMLHKMIDATAPIGQVPEQFKSIATKTLGGVHGVLEQIAGDVTLALYLDKKGRATLVVAADTKNDAKTLASLRELYEVTSAAATLQQIAVGNNTNEAFAVTFKPDSVKLPGGAKGDKLTLRLPAGLRSEIADLRIFLKKNSIDTTTLVKDELAIIAIGAGGRDIVAKVAAGLSKAPRKSLASDGGLTAVRSAMGGCQVCIAGASSEFLRIRLAMLREGDDRGVAKAASAKLKQLVKLGGFGQMGAGVKVQKDSASLGMTVPQSFLFADPTRMAGFMAITKFIGDPQGTD